jgi:uncharacterized membrane protein (DUF2068 family)
VRERKRRRWDAETFVCAFRGHAAPAITARRWPSDSKIAVQCSDHRRFARCLRCDAWVAADPAWATQDALPDLQDIPLPRRGKALRDALVLRAIAIDRAIHAVAFTLVAAVVLIVETHLTAIQHRVRDILSVTERGVAGTGQGASRSFFVRELERVTHLHRGGLEVIFASACVYAVIEAVEAVGLWRERRWAEYLTALATAGFLPFEIHELTKQVTVGRILALVVNVAVLVYLLWAKHLFGIGGGERTDEAEMVATAALPSLPGDGG